MADAKVCPKCSGAMAQGRILKHNEYTARNQYIYVFASDDEGGPDLSKMFSGKPMSKGRKPLAAFSCEGCGFTEFYTLTTS
jgi:predicted nucleic-acid-binding Zn-ribbon protein